MTVSKLTPICPELYLAPMAGLTDWPFRELCRQYGGLKGTFVPMIGAAALLNKSSRQHTLEILDWDANCQDRQVQIFGSSTTEIYEASRILLDLGASELNLNMGCQMPKIVKNGAGSALLRDLQQAKAVIASCVKAVEGKIPISLKLRLGWDHFNTAKLLAQLKDLGINKVFMHGRLASDKFFGHVRLAEMRLASHASSVPFYANGDITDFVSAYRLASLPNCRGLMIGRAALGRPTIFAELNACFGKNDELNNNLDTRLQPNRWNNPCPLYLRFAAVKKHIFLAEQHVGSDELAAVRRLRRHLIAYDCLSPEVLQVQTFAELKNLVFSIEPCDS